MQMELRLQNMQGSPVIVLGAEKAQDSVSSRHFAEQLPSFVQ